MGARYWISTWFLFIALLSSAFFAVFASERAKTPLIVAVGDQPAYGLIYIASERGYFKDEGLNVTLKHFTTGKDALADALRGGSDLAATYETPVVHEIYEGAPVAILGTLHHSSSNTRIIARRSAIASRDDVGGMKTFVTTRGTNLEFFLDQFLRSNGVASSDARILDVDLDEIIPSLLSGRADAAAVWNVSLQSLQARTQEPLIEFTSETYSEISMIAGTDNFVRHNEKTLTKFIKALKRAEEYRAAHEAESSAIITQALPKMDPSDVDFALKHMKLVIRLDNVLLSTLAQEAEYFNLIGLYTGPIPQFKEHVLTTYLEEVDPGSVTLY